MLSWEKGCWPKPWCQQHVYRFKKYILQIYGFVFRECQKANTENHPWSSLKYVAWHTLGGGTELGRKRFTWLKELFFQCVAVLNTKIMSKRHGKIWRNPFGAVRGQTLFPWTRIQTQGAHEWYTHVDVVPWVCIGQNKCGCTQIPVCHSHLFERVLLGYHSALLFFPHITRKSSGEIPTLNSTWKNLFLVFIWQVPLCPEAWLAAGALPCKASCHVEQITILAFGTTLYLWGRVLPNLSCSPCSRWDLSRRLRTPAQALLQNMCLWPHILALPLLCTASVTSQVLMKKSSRFLPHWLHSAFPPAAASIPCITSLEGGIIQGQSIFICCKDIWYSNVFQTSSTHLY